MKIKGVEQNANDSGSTKVFKFYEHTPPVQDGYKKRADPHKYKCSLLDYNQIAKHYTVCSTSHPRVLGASTPGTYDQNRHGVRRHYTEAFTMRKQVYEGILNLCENSPTIQSDETANQGEDLKELISQANSGDLCLTIKNYNLSMGLATYIHEDKAGHKVFSIQGPMGKGLCIKTEGEHIAFAAGTGVLVFIDIVAHLILRMLSEYEGYEAGEFSEPKLDLDKFKFVLYTSFASEKEAIGLSMIEALNKLCEKHGKQDLFTHHSRMSGTPSGKVRWDPKFFG